MTNDIGLLVSINSRDWWLFDATLYTLHRYMMYMCVWPFVKVKLLKITETHRNWNLITFLIKILLHFGIISKRHEMFKFEANRLETWWSHWFASSLLFHEEAWFLIYINDYVIILLFFLRLSQADFIFFYWPHSKVSLPSAVRAYFAILVIILVGWLIGWSVGWFKRPKKKQKMRKRKNKANKDCKHA